MTSQGLTSDYEAGHLVKADTVLREIEGQSRSRFLPIIGPVKGKKLAETVKQFKVKRVLEVGTLIGYSAILIAENLPDDGKVFTIEINPRSARLADENIKRAQLSSKIEVHIGDALSVIPALQGEFDMVFLDATKNEYLGYLKLTEEKLKKGGVVFADNVKIFAGAMQDYLDYVRNSGKYQSQFFDFDFDGVEVSVKLF